MNPASEVNEDFVDMLAALQSNQVDFLIVGAYALAAHGFPRATGAIDIFVSGVEYEEAATDALRGHVGPREVRFIGRAALIKNKSATGRTKDLADVEQLERLESRGLHR